MDNIGMSDGFYHFSIVFYERNRRRWWDINSDRNCHRCIYSAASPFLQILAVLEKIQRLMARCVSRKQVKYYFGFKSITYYFHC